ncbi:hypothetical protein AABH88_001025 [Salmonella enterica subsp. enterica serovar Typhimurium]
MYKFSPQAQQFFQQSVAAEKMMVDMLEETIAKAKADGYDVEMFFDELILTPRKEKNNG